MRANTDCTLNPDDLGGLFFATPVRSDFGAFLRETIAFWHKHSAIQFAVANDLERGALHDKRLRLADQAFTRELTAPLFTGSEAENVVAVEQHLLAGRPRTPAVVVFIMATASNFSGSLYCSGFCTLMLESLSLHSLLNDLGHKLPAANTLGPLVNRLSETTLSLIHKAQLADYLGEGLDTFENLTFDSTSINASSCWPTDASIIYRLLERSCRLGERLARFGLTPLNVVAKDFLLKEVKYSTRAIALLGGGRHRAKRLRRLYDRFYQNACKMADKLIDGVHELIQNTDEQLVNIKPSHCAKARLCIDQIQQDALDCIRTIQQSMSRVHDGITTEARDKVLSLADRSAAYIEKGGREPKIGYKPQLARSGEGFVTALILEAGNGADCLQLTSLVRQSMQNTGVKPLTVSTDDGYASAKGLAEVKEIGVEKVSISGAKGKALLGEQLWGQPEYSELRNMRSGIESLMFTLKYNHGFGRPGRRGLLPVRSELTLKILAYNFDRAVLLRERKQCTLPVAHMPLAA